MGVVLSLRSMKINTKLSTFAVLITDSLLDRPHMCLFRPPSGADCHSSSCGAKAPEGKDVTLGGDLGQPGHAWMVPRRL